MSVLHQSISFNFPHNSIYRLKILWKNTCYFYTMQTKENVINVNAVFFLLPISISFSFLHIHFLSITAPTKSLSCARLFNRDITQRCCWFKFFSCSLHWGWKFHFIVWRRIFCLLAILPWRKKKLDSYLSVLIWAMCTTSSTQRWLCSTVHAFAFNSVVFVKFNHVFCVWNALNSIDFIKNVAKSSFQLMRKISSNFNWNVNAPSASFLVWKTAHT